MPWSTGPAGGMGIREAVMDIYEDTMFADYSDDAIDEAASQMRLVYENREEATRLASSCRGRIVSSYSWASSAKKVYNRLLEAEQKLAGLEPEAIQQELENIRELTDIIKTDLRDDITIAMDLARTTDIDALFIQYQ